MKTKLDEMTWPAVAEETGEKIIKAVVDNLAEIIVEVVQSEQQF